MILFIKIFNNGVFSNLILLLISLCFVYFNFFLMVKKNNCFFFVNNGNFIEGFQLLGFSFVYCIILLINGIDFDVNIVF